MQGTAFQHRVWIALQDIPPGSTASYADIAKRLGEPKAAARLMKAIEGTTEEQVFTPDLGGVHDTRAVTNAVKRAL